MRYKGLINMRAMMTKAVLRGDADEGVVYANNATVRLNVAPLTRARSSGADRAAAPSCAAQSAEATATIPTAATPQVVRGDPWTTRGGSWTTHAAVTRNVATSAAAI